MNGAPIPAPSAAPLPSGPVSPSAAPGFPSAGALQPVPVVDPSTDQLTLF
jgi:hypothetical protein